MKDEEQLDPGLARQTRGVEEGVSSRHWREDGLSQAVEEDISLSPSRAGVSDRYHIGLFIIFKQKKCATCSIHDI